MKKLIHKDGQTCRDPYIIKHKGMYYRTFVMDEARVCMACAETLDGLRNAEIKVVFQPPENTEYSKQIWAPELHIIDNICYIYVTADDGFNPNHRMYVLSNGTDNPMAPYEMKGKITDDTDKWAIDGTVIKYHGKMYYIWAGWEGDENVRQDIYIAEMESPLKLKSKRVLISKPLFDWEKCGTTGEVGSPFINEGPFAVVNDDKLYILYSASACWCENYCIALLRLEGDDPLKQENWVKDDKPILSCNDIVKGAGHCSVFTDEDKSYVVFHAWEKDEPDVTWGTVSVWYGVLNIDDGNFSIG